MPSEACFATFAHHERYKLGWCDWFFVNGYQAQINVPRNHITTKPSFTLPVGLSLSSMCRRGHGARSTWLLSLHSHREDPDPQRSREQDTSGMCNADSHYVDGSSGRQFRLMSACENGYKVSTCLCYRCITPNFLRTLRTESSSFSTRC